MARRIPLALLALIVIAFPLPTSGQARDTVSRDTLERWIARASNAGR